MPGEQPGLLLMMRRGALRRCPVCGEGRIFRSLLRTRRDCSDCGWVLEREPGTVTGAMYLIAIFSQFFAVALWLALWWLTDRRNEVMAHEAGQKARRGSSNGKGNGHPKENGRGNA